MNDCRSQIEDYVEYLQSIDHTIFTFDPVGLVRRWRSLWSHRRESWEANS